MVWIWFKEYNTHCLITQNGILKMNPVALASQFVQKLHVDQLHNIVHSLILTFLWIKKFVFKARDAVIYAW